MDGVTDLLSGTLLGGWLRTKKVYKPKDYHFCPIHPDRWVRGSGRGPKEPCWRCEMEGDSPLMNKPVFIELDELIRLGFSQTPQIHITPEKIEEAKKKAACSV